MSRRAFVQGNESPIEEYVNNTGLMWEHGEQLGALLVWAEHRYEPLSHPALCGNGTQSCFAFCTTAQALADFVALIAHFRTQHHIRAPVVALGGSYGGMLSGWFRMKYPEVVDGAIAASAPIWQLAGTVERESLDMNAVAITRGVSAAGGATDMCRDNLVAAWPLFQQVGRTAQGRNLLSKSMKACSTIDDVDAVLHWAQRPFFFMAEGNYPFPSSYITFAVTGPGPAYPLPAWPMRVACEGLNKDFGIQTTGSVPKVNTTIKLGELNVAVDWNVTWGNGDVLTPSQIQQSGVLDLAEAVSQAVGVWYNLTQDKHCFNMFDATEEEPESKSRETVHTAIKQVSEPSANCPACPPCDNCPPCPVSYCDYYDMEPCAYHQNLSKAFSW